MAFDLGPISLVSVLALTLALWLRRMPYGVKRAALAKLRVRADAGPVSGPQQVSIKGGADFAAFGGQVARSMPGLRTGPALFTPRPTKTDAALQARARRFLAHAWVEARSGAESGPSVEEDLATRRSQAFAAWKRQDGSALLRAPLRLSGSHGEVSTVLSMARPGATRSLRKS